MHQLLKLNYYTGTQDITTQTFNFTFMTSEDFPVRCSIDGGAPEDCEYINFIN